MHTPTEHAPSESFPVKKGVGPAVTSEPVVNSSDETPIILIVKTASFSRNTAAKSVTKRQPCLGGKPRRSGTSLFRRTPQTQAGHAQCGSILSGSPMIGSESSDHPMTEINSSVIVKVDFKLPIQNNYIPESWWQGRPTPQGCFYWCNRAESRWCSTVGNRRF